MKKLIITPKAIINCVLGAFPILIVAGFVTRGASPYFDVNTLALSLISWVFIVFLRANPWVDGNPLAGMATLILMLLFFSRLLIYVYLPESVEFPFEQDISINEINRGLHYFAAGTLSFSLGLTVASRLIRAPRFEAVVPNQRKYQSKLLVWSVVFSLIVIFELYFTQSLEINAINPNKMREYSEQSVLQVLRALFGADTVLLAFMTFLSLPGQWQNSRRQWACILAFSVIVMITLVLNGSRVGPLRIIEFLFAVLLIRHSSAKISAGALVGVLAALLISSALSFSVGDYYRNIMGSGAQVPAARYVEQAKSDFSSEEKVFKGLNRLGAALDYALFVTTHAPTIGGECTERFLNHKYFFKNIVNYLVPGNIFSDAVLNTSRVFSICYRGMSDGQVLNVSGYNSEPWTMWGLALLLYGWWGGLLFIFTCGFAMHAIFYLIRRSLPSAVAPYFATTYVFLMPPLLFVTFGLDHLVNTFIAVTVQLSFVLLLIWASVTMLRLAK